MRAFNQYLDAGSSQLILLPPPDCSSRSRSPTLVLTIRDHADDGQVDATEAGAGSGFRLLSDSASDLE